MLGELETARVGPAQGTEWGLITISTNWESELLMCIEVCSDVRGQKASTDGGLLGALY